MKADTLFLNARVVNVFTEEIQDLDVAVKDGLFLAFGNDFRAEKTVDLKGRYMVPGLIDAHVHIESSMATPFNFAEAVMARGTTTCIADPHEIANVAGLAGIEYMMKSARESLMNILFALPSCVPATTMETAGAVLDAGQLKKMINHGKIVALAEMMNYPGVIFKDPGVMAKIELARSSGKPIDGHAPGLTGRDLAMYTGCGILSDHECTDASGAREKLRLGMHIMIREGTCAKNLDDLFPAINDITYTRMMWCTDDRHPGDILSQGHIDHIIRKAIKKGLDPVRAIKMGTLNTADYFNILDAGAVAPGRRADFIIMDDLEEFKTGRVFVRGIPWDEYGLKRTGYGQNSVRSGETSYPSVMNINKEDVDFSIPVKDSCNETCLIRVIEAVEDQVVTGEKLCRLKPENGFLLPDIDQDILKIAVVERYSSNSGSAMGFVTGMGLKTGAIASSVAHDSHNIIIIGTNDRDIKKAFGKVVDMKGGFCVVRDNTIVEALALPVAGLMSDKSLKEIDAGMDKVLKAVCSLGSGLKDPFMTMGFLALPVIPHLKITDHGIVDVNKFKIVDLFVNNDQQSDQ